MKLQKRAPSLTSVDYRFIPWLQPEAGKGIIHLISGRTEEFVSSWKDKEGYEQVVFYENKWKMEHKAMFYISSKPMTLEEAFEESFEEGKGRFIEITDNKPMFCAEQRYAEALLGSLVPQEHVLLKKCDYYREIDRNHANYISTYGIVSYLLAN